MPHSWRCYVNSVAVTAITRRVQRYNFWRGTSEDISESKYTPHLTPFRKGELGAGYLWIHWIPQGPRPVPK